MTMPELYPWQRKFLDEYMAARERGESPRIVLYQGRNSGRKWVEQKTAEYESIRALFQPQEESMTTKAADEAIEVLNRIHKADPTVLPTLIAIRVPCNDAVRDDPTVQVGPDADGQMVVGYLGIINGFFGVDDNTWGFIAAVYDDEGTLTHFRRTVPADAS